VVKSSNGLIIKKNEENTAIDPKRRRRRLFEASGVKILPKIQNKCAAPLWNASSGMQKVGLH